MDNLEEMDKSLEKCNLPKVNQKIEIEIEVEKRNRKKQKKEIENLNRSITSTELETGIKNLPTNESLGSDGFTGEFYQFREELTPTLLKLSQKIAEEGKLPNHSMRPPQP